MINLDDITIVIPTHERNWLIKKSINYYKTLGCVVVVLDSSENPIELETISSIQYFHVAGMLFPKNSVWTVQGNDKICGIFW